MPCQPTVQGEGISRRAVLGGIAAALVSPMLSRVATATSLTSFASGYPLFRRRAGVIGLLDGRVLAVGGLGQDNLALSNAQVYDWRANSWTTVRPMLGSRSGHMATLLPSGRVLVAGGERFGYLASAQIYDPDADVWIHAAPMSLARTALSGVGIVGGALATGGYRDGQLAICEFYNEAEDKWYSYAPLQSARSGHGVASMPNGTVVVAGGRWMEDPLATTEILDASETWYYGPRLNRARAACAVTTYADGVVALGGDNLGPLASAEYLGAGANDWVVIQSMPSARAELGAAVSQHSLIVAGGFGASRRVAPEVYQSSAGWRR